MIQCKSGNTPLYSTTHVQEGYAVKDLIGIWYQLRVQGKLHSEHIYMRFD